MFFSIVVSALENPIVEECKMPQILTTNKGTYYIATSHFFGKYFILCNFKFQLNYIMLVLVDIV